LRNKSISLILLRFSFGKVHCRKASKNTNCAGGCDDLKRMTVLCRVITGASTSMSKAFAGHRRMQIFSNESTGEELCSCAHPPE
jgi:hypothetical protein